MRGRMGMRQGTKIRDQRVARLCCFRRSCFLGAGLLEYAAIPHLRSEMWGTRHPAASAVRVFCEARLLELAAIPHLKSEMWGTPTVEGK